MKTVIFIFSGLLLWTMMPLEAMADQRGHRDRRSAVYSDQNEHPRYGKKPAFKKDHRQHRHQPHQQRGIYRIPRPEARYIIVPPFRTHIPESRHIYSATPGVSFYYSW